MKTIGKKMLAGTMIASFVLGVGFVGALHNQAYANESTGTYVQKPGLGSGWGDKGRGKDGSLVKDTATLLGVEQSQITDALKEGQTLLQIAEAKGLSEADYVQKLTDAKTASIDAQVTAGTLTREQADQLKSGLSERLKKQIAEQGAGHQGPGRGRMPFGPMGNSEALTGILGVTQEELDADLKAGQSLADIAQTKGITKEELVSKIKDSMTESLNEWVDRKGNGRQKPTPPAEASGADSAN